MDDHVTVRIHSEYQAGGELQFHDSFSKCSLEKSFLTLVTDMYSISVKLQTCEGHMVGTDAGEVVFALQ